MNKKTIVAILTGFAVWTVLWCAANAVVPLLVPSAFVDAARLDDRGVLVFFLGWAVALSALGGAIAARRSTHPTLAGWALGGLLLVVGLGVQASYWSVMPLWFHLLFLGSLVPAAAAGARLARR